MVVTSLLERHQDSHWSRSMASHKMWPNEQQPKTQTRALNSCALSFYTPSSLHEHDNGDITKWHHNHLLPFSGGKNLAHVQWSHANQPAHPLASPPLILTTASAMHELSCQFCIPISESVTYIFSLVEAWYSLEQYIGLKEDKLSSTTVDFIRSEGNLETKCLYWFSKPKKC